MSMRCEEVRPLLAELVYEEVDPALAEQLREHLGTCLSCRRHQMAFIAVRKDLNEWQPAEEATPSGITFIAPGAHVRRPFWSSRMLQGMAIAASFMIAVFLMSAAVNLQVQAGPDGWALSTSFSDQTLNLGSSSEKPELVPVEQIEKLDSWFERELAVRGVAYQADLPTHQDLTPAQMDLVEMLAEEIAVNLVQNSLAQINDLHESYFRGLLESSLEQHSEEVSMVLADVVDQLEARRESDFVALAAELTDTARRVGEANMRIDNLDSLVTQVAAPLERRNPEQ